MVRVLLGGGLGNQLFMYAAGRALAARVGAGLLLDTSLFRLDDTYKRVYLLDQFPIVARTTHEGITSRLRFTAERVLRRFPALSSRIGLWDEPVRNGLPTYDPRLCNPPPARAISLRGNWQSDRYFSDFTEMIKKELVPPAPHDAVAVEELERIRCSVHPVAVGIRFYCEVPGEPSDPQKTVAAFRQRLLAHAENTPGCAYFVFTDSPQFLEAADCLGVQFSLLTPRPRNEDAPGDLHLMTHCRSYVIGYSSFHWWGAWLSTSLDKRVTYLQFPGRPGHGYVAEGWSVAPVSF